MARLSPRNPFNRFAPWRMALKGWIDGRKRPTIPAWTTDKQPPALMELRAAGRHDADLEDQRWAKRDRSLQAAWRDRAEDGRHAADRERESQQTLREAEADYSRWNDQVPAAAVAGLARWYRLILAVLWACETFFNSVVMAVTGESTLFALIIAAGLTAGLVLCAHAFGVRLREEHGTAKAVGITTLPVIGGLFFVSGLAYLRQVYTDGEVVRIEGFSIDPQTALYTYVGFNAGFFIVGAILSYFAHAKGLKEMLAARKSAEKATARREAAERALARARTDREQSFAEARSRVAILQEAVDLRAERYRTANLRTRRDRGDHPDEPHPRSFDLPLTVKTPAVFTRTLSWDVEGDARPRAQAAAPVALLPEHAGDGAPREAAAPSSRSPS